jgi:protein associated with RNAse G/E
MFFSTLSVKIPQKTERPRVKLESEKGEEALVTVQSCKYDGRIHRRWHAHLAARRDTLLVLDAAFEEEICHPHLGTIAPGTLSTEYYWTDRWYNVFRFREPAGPLRNFYCNINTPAEFDGRVLSFIDLDVDVLVAPDFSYRVLDEDEFAINAVRFGYPPQIQRRAHEALNELITLIEKGQFPFTEKE